MKVNPTQLSEEMAHPVQLIEDDLFRCALLMYSGAADTYVTSKVENTVESYTVTFYPNLKRRNPNIMQWKAVTVTPSEI